MNVWDNFGKLNKLNIEFKENASAKKAVIYANGNNQVAVSIKVDISAKNGKPLILPDEELLKAVQIVSHEDGEKLNKKGDGDKAWYYTDENFGYDKVIQYSNNYLEEEVVSSGYEQEVVFYLSTRVVADMGLSLSAGIDIPGVGEFNASKKGTETKNGPKGETGDVFKLPQYVSVRGYTPNSYVRIEKQTSSDKSRRVRKICELDGIIYSGVKDHLLYSATPIASYVDRDSGDRLDAPFSPNLKFVSINLPENKANLDTVKFKDNILPNMIIGRGGDKFSAYFVFFNDIGVKTGIEKGSCFLVKQDSTGYKYKYEIPADDLTASNENAININILECRIDFPDVGKYNWKDTYEDTIITAIDNYGNSYDIKISVDYSSEDLFSVSR